MGYHRPLFASNTRTQKSRKSSTYRTSGLMSRVGLEPTTYGLKVRSQHIRRVLLRSRKLCQVRVLGGRLFSRALRRFDQFRGVWGTCWGTIDRFCYPHRRVRYSNRSASSGSVLDARKAGRYEATSATAVSKAATAPNVTGSVASTPKRNDDMRRVSPTAATSPTTTPIPARIMPCRRTIQLTSRRSAPRAIHTPISRVR